MDGALDWIGQLVQWIGSLIPRIRIVRSTHAGVKFQYGKRIKRIDPGLMVFWPLVTEVEIIPVKRQTHKLPAQCAATKDEKEITVKGSVIYTIPNVVNALSRNWDFLDTIEVIASTEIESEFLKHTYAELIQLIACDSIQQSLTTLVREKLKPYGVRISYVGLTDFAKCLVLNNVGSAGHFVPQYELK
jgi:regulator of protease activity HflC (stomatin/prohibitin superfamily)